MRLCATSGILCETDDDLGGSMRLFCMILVIPMVLLAAPIEVVCGFVDSRQVPIIFEDGSGLATDLVKELNAVQSEFRFQFRLVPPLRLRHELREGLVDIALFDNRKWGWDSGSVKISYPLIAYDEPYISLKKSGRDQSYFRSVGVVPTAGVLGFHYRFANYVNDQKELYEKYAMTLVRDELAVLSMVESGRVEIGVISSGLLSYIKAKEPKRYAKLFISKTPDSSYKRECIIRRGGPISVVEFNAALLKLEKSGRLQKLFARYGLIPLKLK